jgi:hypothetical protein
MNLEWERIMELSWKFLIIIGSFFAPTIMLMLIVGLTILFDTIVGRWSAKVIAIKEGKNPREEVTSRKTRVGAIPKIIAYNLVVITMYLIDYSILNEILLGVLPWQYLTTKASVLFLIWLELDSIDESYYYATGTRLKNRIRDFIRSVKKTIAELINFKNDIKND